MSAAGGAAGTGALAIRRVGLVTPVGLDTAAACAALRAKVSNPSPTRFLDANGEWLNAHQVELDAPWRGMDKLARMAAMAIEEALQDVPREQWRGIPLLLCVAEGERPGRTQDLDTDLFVAIRDLLDCDFSARSAIVAQGRVSAAVALSAARALLGEPDVQQVLIAAADSLLNGAALRHYVDNDRLLTPDNANGFIPGEGAGALLVSRPQDTAELLCTGIGFGVEPAPIGSDEPLRAQGLEQAIRAAIDDAGTPLNEMDFRITDISGEQYYFREAALALLRTLRKGKESMELWHPAECTGETGAVAGINVLALADAACRKAFAAGPRVLVHLSNDNGRRAALVCQWSAGVTA